MVSLYEEEEIPELALSSPYMAEERPQQEEGPSASQGECLHQEPKRLAP